MTLLPLARMLNMYSIAEYDKRYRPTNKSGGELKNADYVKLPVKPKGDGLQTLLEHKNGLEVFAIWCLLLEKTTAQKPETRGKILNFKDEPASIGEIAQSISLKSRPRLVGYAINLLVSIGWVISDDAAEISSEDFRKRPPKLSKDKLSKEKEKKREYSSAVFLTPEEYEKLVARFGKADADERIAELSEGIGSKGYKYQSHYMTILSWARRKAKESGQQQRTPTEKSKAQNQQDEKRKAKIREEYQPYLEAKTTKALKDLKSEDCHLTRLCGWLIDEILAKRRKK